MASRLAAVSLSVLLALHASAAVPAGALKSEDVRTAYTEARTGRMPLEKAVDVADAFLKDHPADPVVTAYKGSLLTMMARDSIMPWRKLGFLNTGLDLLDKAVDNIDRAKTAGDRDPKLEILMVSATTNANIPKVFGRRPAAERDFRAILSAQNFARLNAKEKAAVYSWMAVLVADKSMPEAERFLALGRQSHAETAEQIWSRR